MKFSKIVILLFVLFAFSIGAYGQLWKEYTDRAKSFGKKDPEKAIEFYLKAKEELRKTAGKEHPDYASSCFNLASFYVQLGQYDKAEQPFLEAKQIREKVLGKQHPDYATSCYWLAVVFDYTAQYEKAEPLYLEAMQIREKVLGKEHPDYAFACNGAANFYRAIGQNDKAEPLYLEAKQIQEKVLGKQHPDYAASCSDLATLYSDMGQYGKAEPLYLEAKQIQEKVLGKENPDYATSCNALAILYSDMGQYEKAEPLYLEAKYIREKILGKDHPDYAASCNNLAGFYLRTGRYDKAESLFLESRKIVEKLSGKENPEYAASCQNLAALYMYMGRYEKAEPLMLEERQIIEKVSGKEHADYAASCNNLAALYLKMGQYDKAEALWIEAKSVREKVLGKQHPEYALSCNNLAILYDEMGKYNKAEALYIEAKEIREKVLGKEHSDYAASCNNLASLYNTIGQYEKAEQLYLEAKLIQQKAFGKSHPDYAISCINLANLYLDMRQYEKAESLYLEGKQILEKVLGKEHPEYAAYSYNLARLYENTGKYEKAEPLYLEAKRTQEIALGREHPDYARSCNNLAIVYEDMGYYDKAESLYQEAKHVLGKVLGKQHLDYGVSCGYLANLYRLQHQPLLAEKEFKEAFSVNAYNLFSVFQFTNEKEKTAFIKNIFGEDDKAYSFYISEKLISEQPYSLSLLHRNLILSSSQALTKRVFSTSDTTLINKYNEWINLKKYLAILYSKPVDERKEDVFILEEKAGELEKELTRLSSVFKAEQINRQITWQNIQHSLKTNEAAIEFVEFNYYNGKRRTDSTYYSAIILRKDKPEPELLQLFEKKQLDKLLNSNENLATESRINALYRSSTIYDLTWKPLEKYLSGITKVYFASAGNLFKISFAALPVNDKQVLGDRYRLIQLNTTATMTENDESFITVADKIQLYGGITYDVDVVTLKHAVSAYHETSASSRSLPDDLTRGAGFQYLPGTRHETEEIKRQADSSNVSVTILSGTTATEESVKALSGKSSPSVLHIATHGFFFPDPKDDKQDDILRKFETSGKAFKQSDNPLFRSGLLFAGANNAWTGKPIEGIEDGILTAYEISNMYMPDTKLVVLSACETALGDIQGSEGVYGLQRAFKIAGVQNLVMSLWKVPDAETAEFMQLFYKNLFAKQTISNSFNNAQQVMKNKYQTEPYKWAAWVLVR